MTSRSKARRGARGEVCTLRLAGCLHVWGGDPERETTVLAHLRNRDGITGLALKPDDLNQAVYACHYCHDVLDGRQRGDVRESDIEIALKRTHRRMEFKGERSKENQLDANL